MNLNGCSNFCSKSAGEGGFMSDNAPTGFPDRLKNCVSVPGQDGDDVDDLARHTELFLSKLVTNLLKIFLFVIDGRTQ